MTRRSTMTRCCFPFTRKLPESAIPYRYTGLLYSQAQIRLLTLYPASEKRATIKCSLEIAAFPPPSRTYEAISYAWGDQSTKHQIIVNGGLFHVGQNLYNALYYLRYDTEPRTLWVDAICIDQANSEEKNHQVKQMRDIYSKASRVLVWLGEFDDDIDRAVEYIQRPKNTTTNDSIGNIPIDGLRKIYNKAWWTRMWVVQEVVAATADPLVICGNKSISWESVAGTMGYIAIKKILRTEEMDTVLADPPSSLFFSGSRKNQSELTLDRLLRATVTRDATDPRDCVYSLLGIVSDPSIESFEVNYTKPVRLAYQNAMIYIFRSQNSLDWLAFVSGEKRVAVPSWCVDFSSKTWVKDTARNSLYQGTQELAEGATQGQGFVDVLYDPEAGTIQLRGTRIGVIYDEVKSTTGILHQVAPMHKSISTEEFYEAELKDVGNLLVDTFKFHVFALVALEKRLGLDEAARRLAAGDGWRIIAQGRKFEELVPQEVRQSAGWYPGEENGFALLEKLAQTSSRLRADLCSWSHLLPDAPPDNFRRIARNVYPRIAHDNENNCYFTTEEGFIGLAFHPVQKGDIVCILFGCKWPVVLRRQDSRSYKLIALTYTLDVMDGEFLRDNNLELAEEFILV